MWVLFSLTGLRGEHVTAYFVTAGLTLVACFLSVLCHSSLAANMNPKQSSATVACVAYSDCRPEAFPFLMSGSHWEALPAHLCFYKPGTVKVKEEGRQ